MYVFGFIFCFHYFIIFLFVVWVLFLFFGGFFAQELYYSKFFFTEELYCSVIYSQYQITNVFKQAISHVAVSVEFIFFITRFHSNSELHVYIKLLSCVVH